MNKESRTGNMQQVYPIPKSILSVSKILQSISPSLAAAWSRYFFKKPLEPELKAYEKQWREKAKHHKIPLPRFNKTIHVYQWGDGKKKALVLHGWSSRATRLADLIEKLLNAGYTVYAADAPSHGLSSGRSTNMVEYIESIKEINKRFGPFDAVIGHSMGGISALNAVAKHLLDTKKLVTVGIPDSIERIFYQFAEVMQLKPVIAELNIKYMRDKLGTDIKELAGSYNARKVDIPVLVVHDKDDKEVPFTDAENIVSNLRKGRLYVTEGLGHRRIVRNEKVLSDIVNFLEGKIKPLQENGK